MDAMTVTGQVVDIPVLRPVVGMDKEEIVQISGRSAPTTPPSCPMRTAAPCSPPPPRLRPTVEEAEAAEAGLDVEAMVQAAVEGIERIRL